MLSDRDKDELLNAACQIIDSSLDSRLVFEEACSLAKKFKSAKHDTKEDQVKTEQGCSNTVERFLAVTVHQDGPRSENLTPVLPTPTLAKQIVEISRQTSSNTLSCLVEDAHREKFHICLGVIKSCIEHSSFNNQLFASILLKHGLPVEVTWCLHKIKALDLSLTLSRLKKEESNESKLVKRLVALCQGTQQTLALRQEILSGYMSYLISKGFEEKKTTSSHVYRQVVDSVIQGVLDLPIVPGEDNSCTLPCDFATMSNTLSRDDVKRYSLHTLSFVLSRNALDTVEVCLQLLASKKIKEAPFVVGTVIKQLLLPLTYEDSFGLLTRYLDQSLIHSSHLHKFLLAMYITFPESAKGILEYARVLVLNAIESLDNKMLTVSLCLARMSASIGPHCFPSFANWFQSTFNGPSCVPMTKAGFTFLVKFLTNLVPFEMAEALRVYILKRPPPPPKCKDLYEDFVALAKTRLLDLGASLFEQREEQFDEKGTSEQEKKIAMANSIEQDVQRTLVSYAETKKIPSSLLEASIFRRPYFMGRFLPALLKPRVLPDQPDDRMLLIEEMNRSGKLPASMYSRYIQDCDREKQMLLDGVFDVDDDVEMDELNLPATEQLEKRFDKFTKVILSGNEETETATIHAIMDKVYAILSEDRCSNRDQTNGASKQAIVVDLTSFTASGPAFTICRMLLEFASTCITKWQEKSESGEAQPSGRSTFTSGNNRPYLAIYNLIHVVTKQFQVVKKCLYCTMLLMLQGDKKKVDLEVSSACASFVSICLARLNDRLTLTLDRNRPEIATKDTGITFSQALLLCVDIVNGKENTLRFCLEYVSAACTLLSATRERLASEDIVEVTSSDLTPEDILPSALVKKVMFIFCRHGVSSNQYTRSSTLNDLTLNESAQSVTTNKLWRQLCKKYQLSVEEWVKMELSVDLFSDYLSSCEHWSYLWRMSGTLMQQTTGESLHLDVGPFCKKVMLTLAEQAVSTNKSSSVSSGHSHPNTKCLLSLLQKLLVKLKRNDQGKLLWLGDVLKSARSELIDCLVRYSIELPPHLLFCDSLVESIEQQHINIESATAVVDHFKKSTLNKGAYLSLDATVYILQAVENIRRVRHRLDFFDSIAEDPCVYLSFMVHQDTLNNLELLYYPQVSCVPTWLVQLRLVQRFIEGITSGSKGYCGEDSLEPWQQACALFSSLLQQKPKTCFSRLELDLSVKVYLVEVIVTHLVINGLWTELQNPTGGSMAEMFVKMLSENAAGILAEILKENYQHNSKHSFSSKLGLSGNLGLHVLKELFIIKLAAKVSPRTILNSANINVTSIIVSAYWRVLRHVQDNGSSSTEELHDGITQWIRSLVDCTPPEHLVSIPEFPGKPQQCDILIVRYIQERKRKRTTFR